MLRLVLSFFVALAGHLGLLQVGVDMSDVTPAKLISNRSISVTLNQTISQDKSPSCKEIAQVEKEPERKESPIEQPNVPSLIPAAQLPEKTKSAHHEQLVKPKQVASFVATVHKIKKTLIEPETEDLYQKTSRVTETSRLDNHRLKKTAEEGRATEEDYAVNTVEKNTDEPAAVSSVIEAQPLYQYNPKPEYPNLARRRGWEGIVLLRVKVTAEGEAASIDIHKSSGYAILDKSALRTVKGWRFIPGSKDGDRTVSFVIIPVHYKLEG